MKKSIKKLGAKSIKNVQSVKGGNSGKKQNLGCDICFSTK